MDTKTQLTYIAEHHGLVSEFTVEKLYHEVIAAHVTAGTGIYVSSDGSCGSLYRQRHVKLDSVDVAEAQIAARIEELGLRPGQAHAWCRVGQSLVGSHYFHREKQPGRYHLSATYRASSVAVLLEAIEYASSCATFEDMQQAHAVMSSQRPEGAGFSPWEGAFGLRVPEGLEDDAETMATVKAFKNGRVDIKFTDKNHEARFLANLDLWEKTRAAVATW